MALLGGLCKFQLTVCLFRLRCRITISDAPAINDLKRIAGRILCGNCSDITHYRIIGSEIIHTQYGVCIMTAEQAKEFHEQFKVTYSAFVGLAAVAHLLVFASKPWF